MGLGLATPSSLANLVRVRVRARARASHAEQLGEPLRALLG